MTAEREIEDERDQACDQAEAAEEESCSGVVSRDIAGIARSRLTTDEIDGIGVEGGCWCRGP